MTDQYRATPEQWTQVAICAEMKQRVPWATAACLLELRARVEQLETALLSLKSTVAKAGNDHKSRIEALGLAQRVTDAYIVTAATLSPEERKELGVVTVPEFKAAMARAARQGAENAMAQIRTGAPVVKEFDKEFEPPANCRQRLQRNGMPYPKSGCDACGNMSPKRRQCDAALARSATIEPPPTASDQDLMRAWLSVPGEGRTPALRAVYSLGRQHGSDAKQGAAPATAMTELRAASATHAMTDEKLKIARELTFANCNTLTTIPKITTNYETFVLLKCWYDGDSNLVSDSFVACGDIENLKLLVPPEAELFMPWENVPDDGHYGDKRKRFRIALTPFLQEFNPPHALPIPASAEAQPGSLLERVANAIYNVPHDSAAEARAAIREVAAWLRENDSECQMGGDADATAELLEQEAGQ
jgi:hypothetical protein